MAAPIKISIIFYLLVLISFSTYSAEKINVTIKEVVTAIEKLVLLFKSKFEELNLDGFYGLRVLEGEFPGSFLEHSILQCTQRCVCVFVCVCVCVCVSCAFGIISILVQYNIDKCV